MSDTIVNRGLVAKLLHVLSPREKKQLLLLFPAVVLMSLLDTAGIASIVPFLGLLSDPDAIAKNAYLTWAYQVFAFDSRESFFFFVGLCVVVVLTIGNSFAAFTTWAMLRFSWARNHSLSMRLLESYARRPYSFFLTQNTSVLSQKLLAEVNQVVAGIIVHLMQLGARAVVIGFILTALVVLDPAMALGVGVTFGGVYGGLYWAIRRKLSVLGKERVAANRGRFRLASEMLSGIKEVKLAGQEQAFLGRYAKPSDVFSRTLATAQVLGQLPRFALETVAFGGVLVMVLYLLRQGRPLTDVLPVLGLYAFASYRMLPGLQVIFAGLSSLRTNLPALDTLIEDLPSAPLSDSPAREFARPDPLAFARSIALDRVSFRYPTGDALLLSDVAFEITAGQWVALVGSTGAGKSTLVDLLLGLLEPTDGVIRVDGVALSDDNRRSWQANAGYVPQQIFLSDDTVARNIAFGCEDAEIDYDRVREAARVAQLANFIECELPAGYDTVIGDRGIRFSGGQRQRIGIARALYRQPAFLVLDEATSALDGETESHFFRALRTAHATCTVVSIAHRLTTTRDFDRIYVLGHGAIVDSGTYDELRQRNPHFAAHGETNSPPSG